jgi:hypothetical protein
VVANSVDDGVDFLSTDILGDGVAFFEAELATNGDAVGVAVLFAACFGSIGDEGGTAVEVGDCIVA